MKKKKRKRKQTGETLPDSVNILGEPWEVHYVEQVDKETWLLGSCEHHLRRISIDQAMTRPTVNETLVHEAAHGFLRSLPIGIGLSEENEERWVTAMTLFFMDFSRHNPPFWNHTEEEDE